MNTEDKDEMEKLIENMNQKIMALHHSLFVFRHRIEELESFECLARRLLYFRSKYNWEQMRDFLNTPKGKELMAEYDEKFGLDVEKIDE